MGDGWLTRIGATPLRYFCPAVHAGGARRNRRHVAGFAAQRYLPTWRPDGKALLYVDSIPQIMEVDIDAGKEFRTGAARALFPLPTDPGGWALAPDGKRFLFAVPPGKGHVIPFTVVLNWTAGLKK